jgi:hypothetical protein
MSYPAGAFGIKNTNDLALDADLCGSCVWWGWW